MASEKIKELVKEFNETADKTTQGKGFQYWLTEVKFLELEKAVENAERDEADAVSQMLSMKKAAKDGDIEKLKNVK